MKLEYVAINLFFDDEELENGDKLDKFIEHLEKTNPTVQINNWDTEHLEILLYLNNLSETLNNIKKEFKKWYKKQLTITKKWSI